MEVSAHILGLVVSRLVRARFRIHWTKRQGISAKFAFPVSRLIVGKDGRARLAIPEGVFSAQPARAPLCDTRLISAAIGLLAGTDDSLVSGDKARVHPIDQRLGRRQTVRVMPNPDIADFKPGLLQIRGKPMRHIRETEYSDMRSGFQYPEKFYPNEKVWQNQIPADATNFLTVRRIYDPAINAVLWQFRQGIERIAGHQLDRIPRSPGRHWQSKVRFSTLFEDANVGIHGDRGRAVHARSFSFGPIRWGDILGHPVLLPHLIDAIFSTIRFQTHPIFASVQIGIRSRFTRLFGWILTGAQIGGLCQMFA